MAEWSSPVRHTVCRARLFDSRLPVRESLGGAADFEIKCPRCSRRAHDLVTVEYAARLPHYIPPGDSLPFYCANPNCRTRLGDAALPVEYRRAGRADLTIACPRCKMITRLVIIGLAAVN